MRSLLRTGLLLLPLLAAGCDHIEYHPYDTDISGEQNINAKNIARIEAACRGRQTVRFAMISDTQRWYDGFPCIQEIGCGWVSISGFSSFSDTTAILVKPLFAGYVLPSIS